MSLGSPSTDAHWSLEKQQALGRQFLDVALRLEALGVKEIQLFLASASSVAFRFGQLYDKRLLPNLIVHQYERAQSPPYPWGVRMPVAGKAHPEVVQGP